MNTAVPGALPPGFGVEFVCQVSSTGRAVWDGQDGDPGEIAARLEAAGGELLLHPHDHVPNGVTVTSVIVTPPGGTSTNWALWELVKVPGGVCLTRDGARVGSEYTGTKEAVEALCRWHTEQHEAGQ